MFERVKEIIEDQLGISDTDRVNMETTIHDDLEADSLDAVEIIMSIEDEFDVEIPDEMAEKFVTVADIVHFLEKNA